VGGAAVVVGAGAARGMGGVKGAALGATKVVGAAWVGSWAPHGWGQVGDEGAA
jgi:hypothetical protein